MIKKLWRKNKRIIVLLLLIFTLALFARLVFLDRIPTGISDDELLYVLSSRSFYYSGKDITGQWSPLSFTTPPPTTNGIIRPTGRTPVVLFAPYFGNVNLSLFTARLPYALLSALFVFIIFAIASKLFSKDLGLISAGLWAINPWSIFFGRTAYEAPIAVFFAFLMFALLLYLRSWKIILALPIYFLAFYSYLGTNIILPIFTTIVLTYSWLVNKKSSTKYYILFAVVIFSAFLIYVIRLSNDLGGNRTSEILTPNQPLIASEVNWNRRESIKTPLTGLFINKYEESAKLFISLYLGAFSPVYLFAQGGGEGRFTIWFHGAFYLIDAVFLFFGLIYLFKNRPKEAILLLTLLLIAPIPSAVHYGETQYELRSSFMFPIIIIIVGFGIYSFTNVFKSKLIPVTLLIIVYLIFTANFGYLYFFRNPVFNYEAFGISGRVFADYVRQAQVQGYKVQVVTNRPNTQLLRQYLFFSNKYTSKNYSQIASIITKQSIKLDNITFTSCSSMSLDKSLITIMPSDLKCQTNKLSENIVKIAKYTDNGSIYTIYNDKICKGYAISPYLNNLSLNDFNLEKDTIQEFCQKFFIQDMGSRM